MMPLTIFVSLMFLMAGTMKLMTPKEKLAQKMHWANDFSATTIKLIGLVEVIGALALSLPFWVTLPSQTMMYAAIVLLMVMLGAVGVHLKRKETKEMMMPLVLLILLSVLIYMA